MPVKCNVLDISFTLEPGKQNGVLNNCFFKMPSLTKSFSLITAATSKGHNGVFAMILSSFFFSPINFYPAGKVISSFSPVLVLSSEMTDG